MRKKTDRQTERDRERQRETEKGRKKEGEREEQANLCGAHARFIANALQKLCL